ncbi:MAG: hypothetical protein KAX39_06080 [candidate division Zixibacteria bacterium]|nr:hypothetical protein [candidate division Zixibacteria bacterium]
MTLAELAFACYLYGKFTDYDASYLRFLDATNGFPDLTNQEHRQAILTWLNQWGCRQFSHEYHEQASIGILSWYNDFNAVLPNVNSSLLELTDQELEPISGAYESLANRIASYQNRNRIPVTVRFGPAGAAKVLFAIRSKSLVPWDKKIRTRLGFDSSGISYLSYLRHVKSRLEELTEFCHLERFELSDLPQRLGRPNSSIPKLIDEYYWVTITKACPPPDSATFQRWANWSQ